MVRSGSRRTRRTRHRGKRTTRIATKSGGGWGKHMSTDTKYGHDIEKLNAAPPTITIRAGGGKRRKTRKPRTSRKNHKSFRKYGKKRIGGGGGTGCWHSVTGGADCI